MSHNLLEFKESLGTTDYGLIIGKDGQLKGIWIPTTISHDEVPESIAKLCVETFGINPNASEDCTSSP